MREKNRTLTRERLARQRTRVAVYLKEQAAAGGASDIVRAVRSVVRGRFALQYRDQLLRFAWLDPRASEWAATDGSTLWLSSRYSFDDETLFWTLLHEELHGIVVRLDRNNRASELSEWCEHRWMQALTPRLI